MAKLFQHEKEMAMRIAKFNLKQDRRGVYPPTCKEEQDLWNMKKPDFGYLKEGLVLLKYYGYEECRKIYR